MFEAFVGMLVVYGMIIVVAQAANLLGKTRLTN